MSRLVYTSFPEKTGCDILSILDEDGHKLCSVCFLMHPDMCLRGCDHWIHYGCSNSSDVNHHICIICGDTSKVGFTEKEYKFSQDDNAFIVNPRIHHYLPYPDRKTLLNQRIPVNLNCSDEKKDEFPEQKITSDVETCSESEPEDSEEKPLHRFTCLTSKSISTDVQKSVSVEDRTAAAFQSFFLSEKISAKEDEKKKREKERKEKLKVKELIIENRQGFMRHTKIYPSNNNTAPGV